MPPKHRFITDGLHGGVSQTTYLRSYYTLLKFEIVNERPTSYANVLPRGSDTRKQWFPYRDERPSSVLVGFGV